jgi:hypothetical protein
MATISHPDRFETWANGLSYLSMALALVSYYLHHSGGLVLAVLALLAGAAAIVMSLMPAVRRDFPSIMAISGGAVGVIAAVVRLALVGNY